MSNVKIQGNSSGTGTLTIAAPNTNSDYTLNLPASSGTVLADGASQSPTFNGVTATTLTVNSNNISAVNSLGFRNRIINGDMRIDQRNAGASVTPAGLTGTYTLDRWGGYNSSGSKFTVQRNAGGVTPPAGFTNYLGVTSLSAYSPVNNDEFQVTQTVEGLNFADLGWGTASAQAATLSFWVRSSLPGIHAVSLVNQNTRSYPATYTVNAANTWEYKTITIPGDTSGTWVTDNGPCVSVRFIMGYGSNFVGTANSWNAGNRLAPSGAVQIVGTNGATFYITGVQLEAGSVATPFERRPYGTELALCQRYCIRYGGSAAYERYGYGGAVSNTVGDIVMAFPVPMRVTPTLAATNPTAFAIYCSSSLRPVTSLALDASSPLVAAITATASGGGLTGGQATGLIGNTSTYLTFSAEL